MNKINSIETISINDLIHLDGMLEKSNFLKFSYLTEFFKYDFLFQKKKSEKMVVVFHGAKDQSTTTAPYFERWSWNDVFNCNILNVSDPTLQLDSELKLGWYLGGAKEYALKIIIKVVLEVAARIGVKSHNIIFWGSSGGGFTSLMAASQVDSSTAVAFNPQINTSKYYKNHVRKSLLISYGVESVKDLNPNYLRRVNFLEKLRSEKINNSLYLVMQNEQDVFHMEKHFSDLLKVANSSLGKNIITATYSSSRGHAAEDKLLALSIMQVLDYNLDTLKILQEEGRWKEAFNLSALKIKLGLSKGYKIDPESMLSCIRSFDKIAEPSFCDVLLYEDLLKIGLRLFPRGHNIKKIYANYLYNLGDIHASKILYEELSVQLAEKFGEVERGKVKTLDLALSFYNACDQKVSLLSESFISDHEEMFKYGFLLIDSLCSPQPWLNSWKSTSVAGFVLITHPKCNKYVFCLEENQIIILGDFFVAHGAMSIRDVCEKYFYSHDLREFDVLSGRFAIIVNIDKSVVVLNDAFGSRTLYYSKNDKAISSHAVLLAKAVAAKVDKKVCLYLKQNEYKLRGTYFLPGDLTVFEDVFGLAPNNYYDLNLSKSFRYYSGEPDNSLSFFECIDEYFRNLSKWLIEKKLTPVLGLTSGVDSRVIIAALDYYGVDLKLVTWDRVSDKEKEIIEKMRILLSKHPHAYVSTSLEKGSEGHLKYLASMSDYNSGFWRGRSALTSRMSEVVAENDVFVRGLGGEICRGFYNRHGNSSKSINSCMLSDMYFTKRVDKPSVFFRNATVEYKNNFIKRSNSVLSSKDTDVMDLIYWEQRMGMWAANLLNEMDPALQDFVGINSRKVYASSFSLDSKERLGKELLRAVCQRYNEKLSSVDILS